MEKHITWGIIATVLWGLWAVLLKLSSTRLGHWQSVLVYTVFSVITVVVLYFSLGENTRQFETTGVILAASAGVLGGLALVFFQKAVSSGPVSTVTSISALYPVIAIIFGVVFLRENLSTTNFIGIILAVAAGVLISV
ncbi:MAG: EamA family transporter [Candidatus Fermentibacteraceae bacterium]|nr:EamA family transporter [Candidatus Fermentibacteraceae bacterium]